MKKKAALLLALVMLLSVVTPAMNAEAAWKANSVGKWYTTKDSVGYARGWKKIGKYTYCFNQKGYAQTGWQYISQRKSKKKAWHFFDVKGRLVTRKWVDGYYLTNKGTIAVNTVVDGIRLDEEGNIVTEGMEDSSNPAAPSVKRNIWMQEDGGVVYYNYRGEKAKGWLRIKDRTYYLDPETGLRQTGLVKVDDDYYFFNPKSGLQQKGWVKYQKKRYYFDEQTGAAVQGWYKSANKWYYFGEDGERISNQWILNNKYYMGANGAAATGFTNIAGRYYYFDQASCMKQKGWKLIDGKWYYFRKNGMMVADKWVKGYYLLEDGAMAQRTWVKDKFVNKKGRVTKTRPTGWFTSKKKTYYLDENYDEVTGWQIIEDKTYFFNTEGIMQKNCWVDDFYVGEDGLRYENKFLTIKSGTYYFMENGMKATGLLDIEDKTYLFDSLGVMQTGWQTIGGALFYFNPEDGVKVVDECIEIDGAYYEFSESGIAKFMGDSDSAKGAAIASYAKKFVGNPYKWGGTSLTNGADCSGFTLAVMAHFGIKIPRVAADQATGKSQWGGPFAKAVRVTQSQLKPGDLVFYYSPISHVALYIGNGEVVHASNPSTGIKISKYNYAKPVAYVRYW